MSPDYSPEYWQEKIDEIMDCFDFDKVQKCMEALNWRWASCDGVPEQFELRQKARSILKDCVEIGHGGTGGFVPSIDKEAGCLSLSFVVAEWDAYEEKQEDTK